jgi:hypothetical protein
MQISCLLVKAYFPFSRFLSNNHNIPSNYVIIEHAIMIIKQALST